MNAPITIEIADLALPGIAAADVPRVMASLEAALAASLDPTRLTATSVDRLALDPPPGTPPETLGRLLGAALARQLHGDPP